MADMMIQTALMLSANQYDFIGDDGKENKGTTLRYVLSEDLAPFADPMLPIKGHVPAKATIPLGDFDKFKSLPAIYELTMTNRVDSKGKVSLTPVEYKYVCGINVTRSNKLQIPKESQ